MQIYQLKCQDCGTWYPDEARLQPGHNGRLYCQCAGVVTETLTPESLATPVQTLAHWAERLDE